MSSKKFSDEVDTISLRSYILKVFSGGVLGIVVAFTMISFLSHRNNLEQVINTHSSWLKLYTESFLNDLQIGNTQSVQKRLEILVDGKYFTTAKLVFGHTVFSAKRKEVRDNNGLLKSFILELIPPKKISIPVTDVYKTQWANLGVELDKEVLSAPLIDFIQVLVIFVGSYLFVMSGVVLLGIERETENVFSLIRAIKKLAAGKRSDAPSEFRIKEWSAIYKEFVAAFEQRVELEAQLQKAEVELSIGKIAQQVAHDIRSPLEVLKGLKRDILILPEEPRRRYQLGVNRIEEIAYRLLKVHRKNSVVPELISKAEELLSLMESILMEKKFEYSHKESIVLTASFDSQSYGLFSRIRRGPLKNVLSNLINNAVEAIEAKVGPGEIILSLFKDGEYNVIEVADTGTGIDSSVRDKIFSKGFTSKQSGNGLGLSGALDEIKSVGGRVEFDSVFGKGTVFRIFLPVAEAPEGFVKEIRAFAYSKIIVLDDDSTFHEIWKSKINFSEERFESFYSVDDIIKKYQKLPPNSLLLSDFELMNEYDGIEAILKLDHVEDSILVTARSEEIEVLERCAKEGIKLIPKNIVSYVKVLTDKPYVVLIDDDLLIRISWKSHMESKGIPFKCFNSISAFIENSNEISKDAEIYIDCHLGDNSQGDVESERLYNLGFRNLYLSTGYEKSSIVKPHWIKAIFSKNPSKIIF